MVVAASSVAQSSMGFGPVGASLQHVSEVLCSTGGSAAFLSHLILNYSKTYSSEAASQPTRSKIFRFRR